MIFSQAMAYRALGARVVSIAVMDAPTADAPHGERWPRYIAESADLPVDKRYFSGPPTRSWASFSLLKNGWWPLIHGDQASWLIELCKRAPLPEGIGDERIDLVHANHFFTLPLVRRMLRNRRAPVVLETHDVQAAQFILRNRDGFFVPPYVGFSDLLAIELEWMQKADYCVHLNREEHETFQRLLPKKRHALIYPAVPPARPSRGGDRILTVASGHYPNYLGIKWLLEEVLPLAPGVSIDIVGDVDEAVRKRDKSLFDAHRHLFRGRVPQIESAYEQAGCVLLPTLEGYGLSIRTAEALSSGAPLIATPLAFRGLDAGVQRLRNVTIATDAKSFAAALRAAHARIEDRVRTADSRASDTRQFFDTVFGFDVYVDALAEISAMMLTA
ncbi:glycosyltransferase [Methylosinus sp. PW1]|uniref:glycosyltransferase n=1 Tax=Methylosinus sp. PW1 TaxID=107636 RepID=UPI000A572F98|nr:glycosyltransferase [Methylosinus sp. PW1]